MFPESHPFSIAWAIGSPWVAAGLALLILLVLAAVWLARKTPVRGHRGDPLAVQWQIRALRAEHRAEAAETAVRHGLLPHLARLLRAKLVVGLMSQRSQLLATQEETTDKVGNLEQRLAAAQSTLKQRLEAYEQRIGELENGGPKPPPQTNANSALPASPTAPPPPVAPQLLPAAPVASAKAAPRRNPLRPPAPRADPAPLHFREILDRRHQNSPTRSDPPVAGNQPE